MSKNIERGLETPTEIENFYDKAWLQGEVIKEKRKPITGETPWYYLAGTGFYVREQVSQFIRESESALGKIAPDVVELELSKIRVDIEAFEDEYLKQMLGLKFNLAWQGEGEVRQIVCPDYNNASWVGITDKKEREGAVTETVEKVQEWLKTAPENSFAIIVSPQGWSGLRDVEGDKIKYPETQVYAIQALAGGELKARTLRYNANILENEELLRKFGVDVVPEGNQVRRIKNTLKNVAFIRGNDPEKPIGSFEEIVDKMQSSVGGVEIAYEGKTFDELRAFIKDPDRFTKRNKLTEILIKRFQEYARWRMGSSNIDLEKDLQIALAVTIAQLNNSYEKHVVEKEVTIFETTKLTQKMEDEMLMYFAANSRSIDYGVEKYNLQQLPGCAGGGAINKMFITSMGAPRIVENMPGTIISSDDTEEDYKFDHKGECINCHKDPRWLGPCDICEACDAEMGGKAAKKYN